MKNITSNYYMVEIKPRSIKRHLVTVHFSITSATKKIKLQLFSRSGQWTCRCI